MCGPTLAWNWLVLDLAYVLALVGGGIVLRARGASPLTWILFGVLSTGVGAVLFGATFLTQTAAANAAQDAGGAAAVLAGC